MFSKGDVVQVEKPGSTFHALAGEVVGYAPESGVQVKFFFHATHKVVTRSFREWDLRRV